jgi:hypothetical protein
VSALANLDWLLKLLGWTVGALGLILLLWAVFWDRARGRRRCPKCWYDMHGVPGLVCPECGKRARKESRFRGTRRKWRWATLAAMAVLAGIATEKAPEVIRGGWLKVVPTTVLVLGWPYWEVPGVSAATRSLYAGLLSGTSSGSLTAAQARGLSLTAVPGLPSPTWRESAFDELMTRVQGGRLYGWQTALLVHRALGGDSSRQPRSPPWRAHYGDTLDLVWRQTLHADSTGQGSDMPISAWALHKMRRARLQESLHAVRLSDSFAAVKAAGEFNGGREESYDVSPLGDRSMPPTWVSTVYETNWPWSDGLAGPLAVSQAPKVALLVRCRLRDAELWREHVSIPLAELTELAPSGFASPPLEAAMKDGLAPGLSLTPVYGMAPLLWVQTRHPAILAALKGGNTLALRFEVIHDGRCFATGGVWWHMPADLFPAADETPQRGDLIRLALCDPTIDLSKVTSAGTWMLRVTGEEMWARRDSSLRAYWSGTLYLNLRVTEHEAPWPLTK